MNPTKITPVFIKYDIETFLSIFCVVFKFKDRYKTFEISERIDQEKELKAFLKEGVEKGWFFVGFNNVRFDAQVLQWILNGKGGLSKLSGAEKAASIMEFASGVITKINNREFPPFSEDKLQIKQIDLFLQNHYNNLARSTSLKWLEYSMNWRKIQDLPYKFDEILESNKFDDVIEYCINDVDATDEFFNKSKQLIELRFAQHSQNPDLNLMNKSDSSIGEILFLDMMSQKLNIEKKILKNKQTHHSKIKLKDVILPYINFTTAEFNSVLDYFKEQEIESTKGVFKHILNYKGIEYVYGVGGIHSSWDNKIFESDDETIILDLDVKSFYPNISIRNKFYPKHLSEAFCVLYEELYDMRTKIPKSNPQNTSIKLLLNSCYGKSGDSYSFLYDKFFQMCITVNGQLLLSMLIERLSLIDGVEIISSNTDGTTIKLSVKKKQEVYNVWKWFESITKLELEHAVYKKIFIRDVNNYMAIYDNNKVKYKGAFEIDVEYHKNRSSRITQIAVKRYFVDGIPVEQTVKNHLSGVLYEEIENQGIYDFCIGKKIKSNQNYTLETDSEVIKNIEDKVIRFYVSSGGVFLYKNYNDGRKEVTVGNNKVTMFMDYYESEDYDIDYNYYIDQANRIIHEVDGTNERLEKEAKERREQEKRNREEEKFLQFCLEKAPTTLQLKTYGKEWLIEKYGLPKTREELKLQEIKN